MFEAKVLELIKIVPTNWTQSVQSGFPSRKKQLQKPIRCVERNGTIIIYHYKIKVLSFLQMSVIAPSK